MRGGAAKWWGAALALVGAAVFLIGCTSTTVMLQGQLSGADANEVLPGVQVAVLSNTTQTVVVQTVTDATGHYSFDSTQLPAGTYRVRFSDADWWSGAASWSTATPVAVSTSSVTTIDEVLDPATGSVAGTVTASSQPLGGALVEAVSTVSGTTVRKTTTASDGTYSFGGAAGGYASGALPTGSYRLRFSSPGKTTRYSGSAYDASGAPVIVVTNGGSVSGVDTTLAPQSVITGTVTDGRRALPGLNVVVSSAATGDVAGSATTGSDGTFTVSS